MTSENRFPSSAKTPSTKIWPEQSRGEMLLASIGHEDDGRFVAAVTAPTRDDEAVRASGPPRGIGGPLPLALVSEPGPRRRGR
jgi:hypothetical protein